MYKTLCLLFLCVVTFSIYLYHDIIVRGRESSFFYPHKSEDAEVRVMNIHWCNVLQLSNGDAIVLAGVLLRYEGTAGYKKELCENFEKMLVGKKIRYKTILKWKQGINYPRNSIALVYLDDGTFLNETLLKEGMAFFDHGYYKGKEHFYELQEEARRNKRGMWGSDNPPRPRFVGKKDWRFIHYPECPEVKDLPEGEKIYFYFHPPSVPGGRIWAYNCSYCAPRHEEETGQKGVKVYPAH